MKKLIIDRTTWLRGEGNKYSFLLRKSDQKMCCLGSYGIQLAGKSPVDLEGKMEPSQCATSKEWGELVVWRNRTQPLDSFPDVSGICEKLMLTNDNHEISDSIREEQLKEHFKSIGVEAEFVN